MACAYLEKYLLNTTIQVGSDLKPFFPMKRLSQNYVKVKFVSPGFLFIFSLVDFIICLSLSLFLSLYHSCELPRGVINIPISWESDVIATLCSHLILSSFHSLPSPTHFLQLTHTLSLFLHPGSLSLSHSISLSFDFSLSLSISLSGCLLVFLFISHNVFPLYLSLFRLNLYLSPSYSFSYFSPFVYISLSLSFYLSSPCLLFLFWLYVFLPFSLTLSFFLLTQ